MIQRHGILKNLVSHKGRCTKRAFPHVPRKFQHFYMPGRAVLTHKVVEHDGTDLPQSEISRKRKACRESRTGGRERLKSQCQPAKGLASHEEISHSLTLVRPPGRTDQSQDIARVLGGISVSHQYPKDQPECHRISVICSSFHGGPLEYISFLCFSISLVSLIGVSGADGSAHLVGMARSQALTLRWVIVPHGGRRIFPA